jgi:hypothetical protein
LALITRIVRFIASFATVFKFRYDFQMDARMERFLLPHIGGDLQRIGGGSYVCEYVSMVRSAGGICYSRIDELLLTRRFGDGFA